MNKTTNNINFLKKVIYSCKTIEQLNVAYSWAQGILRNMGSSSELMQEHNKLWGLKYEMRLYLKNLHRYKQR